jgi:hypothetical protein
VHKFNELEEEAMKQPGRPLTTEEWLHELSDPNSKAAQEQWWWPFAELREENCRAAQGLWALYQALKEEDPTQYSD